jgi:hypothetical protein
MKHRASRKFWQHYRQLSVEVRRVADKNYALLKVSPNHPSLHFKQIGRYWSVRVGLRYRAVAVQVEQDLVWFWIGTHSEYNAIVWR